MDDQMTTEGTQTTKRRDANVAPLRVHVARVVVLYEVVELPEECPICGAVFCDPPNGERTLKEVNLADTSFVGSMVARNLFEPDSQTRVEEPETFWFPYRYECAACGEVVAGGEVQVAATPAGTRADAEDLSVPNRASHRNETPDASDDPALDVGCAR